MRTIYIVKKIDYGYRYEFVIDGFRRCLDSDINFFIQTQPGEYDRLLGSRKDAIEYVKRLNRGF